MDKSLRKTRLDRNAPAANTGQLWARIVVGAVLGALAALIAAWVYALLTDGDFTFGGAASSMVGAGLGLAVVVYLSNRRRLAHAPEPDDEVIDNLPTRLG